MSEREPPKRRVDSNATIQIDMDQVQVHDPHTTSAGDSRAPGARKTPPPLPGPLPIVTLAPPARPGKTVAYVAFFVVLIGAAIAGGLLVGMRVRRDASTASTALPATAARPASSAAPSASSAAPTLTIPTLEIR